MACRVVLAVGSPAQLSCWLNSWLPGLPCAVQMAESFRALRLVLSGALPMARALRTLGALDPLLRTLAAETAAALRREDEDYAAEQQQPSKQPRLRPAMAFVAAGLGTSRLASGCSQKCFTCALRCMPGMPALKGRATHACIHAAF